MLHKTLNKTRIALATLALLGAFAGAQAADKAPAKAAAPATDAYAQKLDTVLAGSWRSDKNKARDQYRHPKQTLQFFGLKAGMSLIELTPGGGWYAEILAPVQKGSGHYTAAIVTPKKKEGEDAQDKDALSKKFAADPERYSEAKVIQFDSKAPNFGPANSADMVVTFRNVHNWVMNDSTAATFKAAFDVLKPGGVLGVTDHRAAPGTELEKTKKSGYITEEYVIKMATDAGFKLDSKSEINANPKDTKDYPEGVWTLPPTLELKDKDREKYLAIGESDRMTLRFVKPGSDKIFSSPEDKKADKAAKH